MKYIRRVGDVSYRCVSLKSIKIPEFYEFTMEDQLIACSDSNVLEVRREDGTTTLFTEKQDRQTVLHNFVNGECRIFPLHEEFPPLARLWVRDSSGVEYKVPAGLPTDPNKSYEYFLLSAPGSVELVGDKYFNQIYEL